jgi:DNA helicase HerA-like ATPase
VEDRYQIFEEIVFDDKVSGKINGGPYAGEFDRFSSRLDAKMNDDRLDFLLHPLNASGSEYTTADLSEILRQFTGYTGGTEANVTIIDLSGIPFEVLSVVVSLITRLVFDFCFHFKRLKDSGMELPFLLVYEEAHNYIPQSEGAKYGSVKKSIERVAKEGRKYGISLMIVSQRPSEISETIFSQCNNFVAMRLTNPADQQYIKRLLPDSVSAITDALPILEKQEAIIIGDAIAVPSIVKIDDIEDKPNSHDIDFHTEWKKDWLNLEFERVIRSMKREPSGVAGTGNAL